MDSADNPFLYTFRLRVKTPFSVISMVIVVHVFSLFLPWFTSLAIWIKLVLSTLVLLGLVYYLNRFFFLPAKEQVSELILSSDDSWTVKTGEGQSYEATLGHVQYVHPLLTIVSLQYNKRTHYFIFTPEVIEQDQFRRLRVRLRYRLGSETDSVRG